MARAARVSVSGLEMLLLEGTAPPRSPGHREAAPPASEDQWPRVGPPEVVP